jgi:hypothetical protein
MRQMLKFFPLTVMLAAAASCSTDRVASVVAAGNDSNIKRAVNLYRSYQISHGWQGPKDEQALKDFVADVPEKNLQMAGIDPKNVDKIFKSDRDGKAFKIRYGVTVGRDAIDALVFEDEGANGKKLVAFNGPIIEEVTDSHYKELWDHGGRPTGAQMHPIPVGGGNTN